MANILVRFGPLPQLMPGSLLLSRLMPSTPLQPYRIRVLTVEGKSPSGLGDRQPTPFETPKLLLGAVEDPSRRAKSQWMILESPGRFVTYYVQTGRRVLRRKGTCFPLRSSNAKECRPIW